MSIVYLELSDFLAIAAAVTGQDAESLVTTSRLDLADSALNAPSASFGGVEFYPDFVDKAAVLLVRIAKNHPLMDGNKRAAWTSMRMFIEFNDWQWAFYPSVDEAERACCMWPVVNGRNSKLRSGSGGCSHHLRDEGLHLRAQSATDPADPAVEADL